MGKIKIKCLKCGDTIEPTYKRNYNECTCKNVFVEGGTDYLQFGGNIKDKNSYIFIKDGEEIKPEDMIIENNQSITSKILLKRKKQKEIKINSSIIDKLIMESKYDTS
ncbi:MAG: hypothetical protein U9Q27_03385 [Patescibacteria group bacterium]|nr:hypothetical protein [Patescibacteria group bacterium]